MYTYPNGLQCDVSEQRINAFEAIVPPIAVALIFAGFAFAAWLISDHTAVLRSFVLIMTAGTVWSAVCALAASKVFDFWCKPIHEGI